MGVTYIEGVVVGSSGKQVGARFLVDSGATYTLLPDKVWRAVELTPSVLQANRLGRAFWWIAGLRIPCCLIRFGGP